MTPNQITPLNQYNHAKCLEQKIGHWSFKEGFGFEHSSFVFRLGVHNSDNSLKLTSVSMSKFFQANGNLNKKYCVENDILGECVLVAAYLIN